MEKILQFVIKISNLAKFSYKDRLDYKSKFKNYGKTLKFMVIVCKKMKKSISSRNCLIHFFFHNKFKKFMHSFLYFFKTLVFTALCRL